MNNQETSIGGHIKSAGKKIYHGLIGKSSLFDIIKIVSYNDINGNPKQEIPELNGNISHIYMGKMNEEEIGIYSDDFLKGILLYYIGVTTNGENISLELANCVSEVLGENMEGFMNFERQKEYIEDLVKKNFGKKIAKTINIINLESRHPELFTELRKYEKTIKAEASKKGLSIGELDKTPSFDNFEFLELGDNQSRLPDKDQDFNSLDIAKYLYRVCKINPVFFDKIKAIKPEKAKSEFYPLIEIAIRLTDFIKGVSIQGGALKQKNYDAIIKEIINPYMSISTYPEMIKLREFCIQKVGDRKFETIYMDGNSKRYRTFADKISNEKTSSIKIRTYTTIVAMALSTALSTPIIIKDYKTRKLQKQTQETIKEIFENKRVARSSDMWGGEYEGEEKIEAINGYLIRIYDRFVFRYGDLGKFSEDQFKSKIIDCLNDQEVLDIMGNYRNYGTSPAEDKIIDDYLIPRNIGEFRISGINTTPYSKYLKYTDAFVNTILLQQDWETNRDASVKMDGVRGHSFNYSIIDEIGPYSAKEQGYYSSARYVHQLAQVKKSEKSYIVATGCYSGKNFQKSENPLLYTSRGRELAIDFLKQTYPIINELLDQYLLRYYKRYSNTGDLNGYYKSKMPWEIEILILRDFLSQGLLKKIDKKQTDKIISYLDKFVIENQNDLKKLQSGIMPNLIPINASLIPNGILEPYEQAMKNTITDKDKLFAENSWLPVNRRVADDKEMIVKQLGKYRASDGKMYLIGKVKIDGKEYLYAEEEGRLYKDSNDYGVYHGEVVAKDYFKTKSDFLQKKLLHEKKLKSDSQRHIDVNEIFRPDKYRNYVKNNPKGIVPR